MFSGTSDFMVVRSDLPEDVAGVELEIGYDPSAVTLGKPTLKEATAGMSMTYKDNGSGQLRVLMNFTNPHRTQDLIHAGVAELIDIPISARQDIQSDDKTKLSLRKAFISTAVGSAGGRYRS